MKTSMRLSWLVPLALLAACPGLDAGVLYRCEPGQRCLQAGETCWSDDYCHAGTESPVPPNDGGASDAGVPPDAGLDAGGDPAVDGGADAGLDGGTDAGLDGGADAGVDDGGSNAGRDGGADAGVDGGTDAGTSCVPLATCSGAVPCGFVDAGCGAVLRCGPLCAAGLECGAVAPNTCAPARLCSRDGWCAENPLPQGHTLRAAWAADEQHAWFVGDDATVLLWNGERHQVLDLPVGEGVDFLGVGGTSARDVFVVGTRGTIVHFDGAGWTVEAIANGLQPELRAVAAAPSGEVLAVGAGTMVLRRDGTGSAPVWVRDTVSGTFDFHAVALDGDGRFLVGGEPGGVVLKQTGPASRAWASAGLATTFASVRSLWVAPGGTLFLAGAVDAGTSTTGLLLQRDPAGSVTTALATPAPLHVVRGRAVDDVTVAGAAGAFRRLLSGAVLGSDTGAAWHALAALPGYDLLEGEGGQVGRVVGAATFPELVSSGPRAQLNALCGSSPGTLLAPSSGLAPCTGPSCSGRVLERAKDGGPTWTATDITMPDTTDLTACFVRSGFQWVVGSGTHYAQHSTGTPWFVHDLGTQGLPAAQYIGAYGPDFNSVYFINSSDPVGTGPFIARARGAFASPTFTAQPFDGGGDLALAIGGDGVNTFVLGQRGLVLGLDPDGGFSPRPRVGSFDLRGAAGASLLDGGQLFVGVGAFGALYRKEGDAGFVADGPMQADFRAVWVGDTGEAWAVGGLTQGARTQSRVYRKRPGDGWRLVPLLDQAVLRGVWGSTGADGGTTVWVAGPGGTIVRKDPWARADPAGWRARASLGYRRPTRCPGAPMPTRIGDRIATALKVDTTVSPAEAKDIIETAKAEKKWTPELKAEVDALLASQGTSFQGTAKADLQQFLAATPTQKDLADPKVLAAHATKLEWVPVKDGQLFVDGVDFDDVAQGYIGDCYLGAALSAVAKVDPGAIQKAIKDNGDGTYNVRFFEDQGGGKPMKPVTITIDGDLPKTPAGGNAYYAHARQGAELWPGLLEKAYAQWKGGYDAIGNGGNPGGMMANLTGKPATYEALSTTGTDALYSRIKTQSSTGRPMSASTYGDDKEALYTNTGVHANHAYTVLGAGEENGQKYVQVRNPWGFAEGGHDGKDDGIFKLPLADFHKLYQGMDFGG